MNKMVGKNLAPVIIKRKKVIASGGHHGGAWKVAYADFVTAMMAFFMLMWLLNATTEKQRKGLADYFHPTIAVIFTDPNASICAVSCVKEVGGNLTKSKPLLLTSTYPSSRK